MYLCTGWHWKSASSLLRVFPTIFLPALAAMLRVRLECIMRTMRLIEFAAHNMFSVI